MMTMMMTIVHVDHFCDPKCKLCAFSLRPWRITAAIIQKPARDPTHLTWLFKPLENQRRTFSWLPWAEPTQTDWTWWINPRNLTDHDCKCDKAPRMIRPLSSFLFSRKDLGEGLSLRYHSRKPVCSLGAQPPLGIWAGADCWAKRWNVSSPKTFWTSCLVSVSEKTGSAALTIFMKS